MFNLKPCPHPKCKRNKAELIEEEPGLYMVRCRRCGLETIYVNHKVKAIKDWNSGKGPYLMTRGAFWPNLGLLENYTRAMNNIYLQSRVHRRRL